jgi:hypothetical protein
VYHDAPPDKKGPAPNRGAKEDGTPFPKSRGRGGELRDPGPANLFSYLIRQHRRIVATKQAPRGGGGA